MDGEALSATVHGVAKSRTRLSDFTSQAFLKESQPLHPNNFVPKSQQFAGEH